MKVGEGMAKSKRSKKSKSEIMSETLRIRVGALLVMFVVVIAALRLGIVGDGLHYVFAFISGNLFGVVYAVIFMTAAYVMYQAKLPKYKGPEAVGIYLMLMASHILASVPADVSIKGPSVINSYINSGGLNKGGLVGVTLYGILSGLIDQLGAIIFSILLLLVGIALFSAKIYVNYKNKIMKAHKSKKSSKVKKDEPVEPVIIKSRSKFFDFKTKGKTIPLFPDEVFEEKKKEFMDDEIIQAFEFTEHELEIEDDELPPLRVHTPLEEDIIEPPVMINEPIEEEIKPKPKRITGPYKLPPLSLLSTSSTNNTTKERASANKNAARLTSVLEQFGVKAAIENAYIGPTITKYELKLETGTRVNKILQLQDDIKLALATADIRIEAPIPGKPYVGIEIPNQNSSMVGFKDVLRTLMNDTSLKDNKLVVALGKDVSGKPLYAELDKMPHLLIAGATGSGKSVCVNTIISSILMRAKPNEVKLILVDPKKVELSIYNGIPHLLSPVVTDPKKAAAVLRQVVVEMERRYDLFANVNARNIKGYNDYVEQYNSGKSEDDQKEVLSYHVVILDEVADLMMVASKEVEDCIMRISQMARAAGIHLIVATQRPSTDIITGVIKANIPSRIAFAVSSSIDSRTILDASGAEKLLGKGDMLFSPMGSSSPTRVQGCFVSDDEVSSIVHYVAGQQEAHYEEKFTEAKFSSQSSHDDHEETDEEYEMCREFVIQVQKASTSLLQRKFRIGYNKAARIIDQLEEDGIIGPQLGSKPREVYIRQYNEEEL